MHQESYEKFCFVGISCTILHTKAAQAIQLTQLLEPADDFPVQTDLGTSPFHPLLFVASYVLPVWYNLDMFFFMKHR